VYKRIIQVILILAALALIVYVYVQLTRSDETYGNAFEAIPSGTTLLMEVSDINALEEDYPIIALLSSQKNAIAGVSFNPMSAWYDVLSEIDSVRTKNDSWYNALLKTSIVFAASEQGRGDTWLFSIGLKKGITKSQGSELMNLWLKESNQRSFKGSEIHQTEKYFWAEVNSCLVVSPSGSMVEDAIINSTSKKNINTNATFTRVREMASKDVAVHFYASFDDQSWLQIDPSFVEGQGMLSGYTIISDSTQNNFKLSGSGAPFQIQNHLPSNTSILDVYSYTDFETGWRMQEDYHMGTTSSKFWSQAWKDLGDTCQCDLNAAMLSWRSGEWGTAVITLSDSSTAEVAFYGMRDSVDVIKIIEPVLDFSPDKSQGIHKLKYPQLFERNQPGGVLVENNYITQIGEYVFTAATPGELSQLKNPSSTLSNLDSFKESLIGLNNATGRFVFMSDFYASPLPAMLMKVFTGNKYIATTAEHIGDDKYLINIRIPIKKEDAPVSSDQPSEESATSSEEVSISQGPWVVINHNTKEKEQLFVSTQNELCLQGSDKKILWKKSFTEKILGEVIQLDVLKNGKLQMAFASEGGIHLIDRNGNELTGFPFQPKSPIASPLHVADYDKNKKYRLLFASVDGSIWNLTSEGKTTEGWKHKNESSVIKYITDFKIGADDHILTVSITGALSILKRTGEIKHTTSITLDGYDGGKCSVTPGSTIQNTKIIYTDKSGAQKTATIGS
jgi:hypothetical protein